MTEHEAIKVLDDMKVKIDLPKAAIMQNKKNEALDMAIQVLKQSQFKTGHWIITGDYYTGAYGTIDYVECSCCHEDSLEEGDYCPNCGAKMVEPQERS